MKFLVATTNLGKVREFREMLASERFEWIGLADLPPVKEVEETGHTFRSNAALKASEYACATGLWTMADDSGLEVDALDRQPGIHSARWAMMHGLEKGDQANNTLLLKQLENVPAERRSARFVCALAIANPSGQIMLTTRATMEGRIILTPAGTNGFGYDPIFQIEGWLRTSAELPPAVKNHLSHRGKALQRMKDLMHGVNFEKVAK